MSLLYNKYTTINFGKGSNSCVCSMIICACSMIMYMKYDYVFQRDSGSHIQ